MRSLRIWRIAGWRVCLWLMTCGIACACTGCVSAPHSSQKPQTAPPLAVDLPAPPLAASEVEENSLGEQGFLKSLRQLSAIGRNGDASFTLDGTEILYQTLRPPVATERLVINDIDGRRERFIGAVATPATGASATAAGLIYSYKTGVTNSSWQLAQCQAQACAPIPMPAGVDDARDASYAAGSAEVFFSAAHNGQRDLYAYKVGSGALEQLTDTPSDDEGAPSASADGMLLVYWRGSRQGDSEIFLLDRKHADTRQLTALKNRSVAPSLHPDGSCVVFSSAYYGEPDYDLFVVDLASGRIVRVTDHPGFDSLPRFSPDGAMLTWTSSRQGGVPQVFIAQWSR